MESVGIDQDKSLDVMVFVAGSFTGDNQWEQTCNVHRAEEMGALLLVTLDIIPIVPHRMFKNYDGLLEHHQWLMITKKLLSLCHAVVFLENWEASKGSREEHEFAKEKGIPIFYEGAGLVHDLAKHIMERDEKG